MGLHTITTSYIPNPDPDALMWMESFARGLRPPPPPPEPEGELKPAAFGVDVAQVQSLAALVRDFDEKLAVAHDPSRCTGPAITAKIQARNAATLAIQPLVKLIRARPEVTDADLLALGLRPNSDRRPAVPAPDSAPILAVIASHDGVLEMRYADSLTPLSRRKPDGVMHLQLYMAVGPNLAGDVAAFTFHSLVTKCPFRVQHDRAHNGKMATFIGRWSTRTGLTGPWSLPVGMTVSFVQRGGAT